MISSLVGRFVHTTTTYVNGFSLGFPDSRDWQLSPGNPILAMFRYYTKNLTMSSSKLHCRGHRVKSHRTIWCFHPEEEANVGRWAMKSLKTAQTESCEITKFILFMVSFASYHHCRLLELEWEPSVAKANKHCDLTNITYQEVCRMLML